MKLICTSDLKKPQFAQERMQQRLNMFKKHGNCSARDWERSGLLEENPQSGCTEIRASLKGPL